MNKQELIKHIEDLPYSEGLIVDTIKISRKGLLELVSQLDEPKKVKIPEFAADVIEGARGNSAELDDALFYAHEHGNHEFKKWYGKLENRENFARAFLNGYDIKQEKRYIVKVKAITSCNKFLSFSSLVESWFFCNFCPSDNIKQKHTRKELEAAGFGWVFDCPGIEIEEVEE